MKNTIVIKVTKQDIIDGKPNNAACCPIAKACLKTGAKKIFVDKTFLIMNHKIYRPKTYRDLIKMSRFVGNFDRDYLRNRCRPTTITLVKNEN